MAADSSGGHPLRRLVCATGELEPPSVLAGGRSRDFTDPLRQYERQGPTAAGTWAWLKRSLNPFPPPGLRHTSLPITGIMVCVCVSSGAGGGVTN